MSTFRTWYSGQLVCHIFTQCDLLTPDGIIDLGQQWFKQSRIARFMGPTWGPPGADRTLVGPMLAPWTLLSGMACHLAVWHHMILIWTYFVLLFIGLLGTNLSKMCIKIQSFSLKKKLSCFFIFQARFSDQRLRYLLSNCLQVIVSEPQFK